MCCNNKVDKLSMVVQTKRKNGVVRSKSADNKQNQFQWQEVVKRNKFPTNNENGHLAFGVRNTDRNEDGNPISTPIMNSLRGYKSRGYIYCFRSKDYRL
jgi:hypothetical protein